MRFLVRLAIATGAVRRRRRRPRASCCPGRDEPSHLGALLRLVVITGADVLVFLALTRALRLTEVTAVLDTVTRRLRPRSRSSD